MLILLMRLLTVISLLLLCLLPSRAQLQPGDLVAVCGDSITEQRRYSLFIEDYLLMCQPVPDVQVIQMGWNGETAPGFLARMANDALPFKPTVVTTCFGMNDGGSNPLDKVHAEKYRAGLDGIAATFKKSGVRWTVIGSPGVVDTKTYVKTDATIRNQNLAQLTEVAREVADRNHTGFADIHDVMRDVMAKAKAKYGQDYQVAGADGVHPTRNGHLIMASAFLKALQCTGDIGTITYDFKTGKAEVTAGHQLLSAGQGRLEIESEKYPFCFTGELADPDGTRGITEFFPFNDDLNRLELVIKNPPPGKLEVAWGTVRREFDAAALAKGINLAAEFPDNPFSQPFAAVEQVIREQQNFDVVAVKSLLHSLIAWRQNFPERSAAYDEQAAAVIAKAKSLREKARAAVKPVRHTITIRPVN